MPLPVIRSYQLDASTGIPEQTERFGQAVCSFGPVGFEGRHVIGIGCDGNDGYGGITNNGRVVIAELNTNGTVRRHTEIELDDIGDLDFDDLFGSSLAYLGVIKPGNSNHWIAVGAIGQDASAGAVQGIVYLVEVDATTLAYVSFTQIDSTALLDIAANDRFGYSIASLGDLDSDSHHYIAVGVPSDDLPSKTAAGTLRLIKLDPTDWTYTVSKIDDTTTNGPAIVAGEEYGSSTAYDVTNQLLAVGAAKHSSSTGRLHIHKMSGAGITTSYSYDGTDMEAMGFSLLPGDGFGRACCWLPDFKNSGQRVLAVSAYKEDKTGTDMGVVYVLYFNASTLALEDVDELSERSRPSYLDLANGDEFGTSLCYLDDLDGNGKAWLVAGAPLDDYNYTSSTTDLGEVYLLEIDNVDLPALEPLSTWSLSHAEKPALQLSNTLTILNGSSEQHLERVDLTTHLPLQMLDAQSSQENSTPFAGVNVISPVNISSEQHAKSIPSMEVHIGLTPLDVQSSQHNSLVSATPHFVLTVLGAESASHAETPAVGSVVALSVLNGQSAQEVETTFVGQNLILAVEISSEQHLETPALGANLGLSVKDASSQSHAQAVGQVGLNHTAPVTDLESQQHAGIATTVLHVGLSVKDGQSSQENSTPFVGINVLTTKNAESLSHVEPVTIGINWSLTTKNAQSSQEVERVDVYGHKLLTIASSESVQHNEPVAVPPPPLTVLNGQSIQHLEKVDVNLPPLVGVGRGFICTQGFILRSK